MSIQLTSGPTHSLVGLAIHSHLEGTAPCAPGNLLLRSQCNTAFTPTKTVPVAADGTWTADLGTCECGQQITIQARCDITPLPPWETLWTGSIPCPSQCCPTVTTRTELGECVGSMRYVKLVADVTVPLAPCPPVGVRWDFGDGGTPPPWTTLNPGTTTSFESTHRYPCGSSYTAALEVSTGSDFICPPERFRVGVPCCGCCPTLSLSPTVGPCDANGQRTVQVAYTISQADPTCPAVRGELSVPGQAVSVSGPAPLSGTLTTAPLAPGQYTATLTLGSPAGCPPVQASFNVPPCDCCPASVVTSEVDEKCNGDHLTKHVEVEAVVTPIPGCPVQAEMSIEGTVVASGSGAGPFALTHAGDYDCGRHPVTISYPGTDCPPGGGEFCVSVCEPPKCKATRKFFEMAATVALIALVLYLFGTHRNYLLYTSIGAAGSALLIYLFCWLPCLKRCRRCQLLLVLWEILLATFLGCLVLGKWTYLKLVQWLSFTLPIAVVVILIILMVLVIAFIIYLLYRLWVARCCPTECERWTEVYDTLTYVHLAATGIVTAIITNQGHASVFLAPWWIATGITFLISWVLLQKLAACKG